ETRDPRPETRPLGLIVNPASGKDIRRLVAHASVFDNREKGNILRRVILGAVAAGATSFLYVADAHGVTEGALDGLKVEARFEPVQIPHTDSALDTIHAAERLREAGCGVVVTLGGDGTNRAVALGWQDAPLVPISTGTNNVFPQMIEGTVAGAAAGLVATGTVRLEDVATQAKTIQVQIEGERDDLALIDAALLEGAFAGSRAIWDSTALRLVVLARAEPAAVGLSAVGGLLDPVGAGDDCGLCLTFGGRERLVRAPLAPGLYQDLPIRTARRLALSEVCTVEGPGILAFDGERERRLRPGQRAVLTVRRDGPRVVNVERALAEAAWLGVFQKDRPGDR
ncbi:MAG: NAD(+)/NADH kinase, partial [Dehalococcoidia bacterium]